MSYVRLNPGMARRRAAAWTPATDVVETKDGFKLSIDLPGFNKSDIKVNVEDGVLSVSGERLRPEDEAAQAHHLERPPGRYENGVLNIDLHTSEEARARTIAIS